jgi:hypothetical protein
MDASVVSISNASFLNVNFSNPRDEINTILPLRILCPKSEEVGSFRYKCSFIGMDIFENN